MVEITICPFCLTICLYELASGDDCPVCSIGVVENIDDYYKRIAELESNERRKNDS